MIAASLVDSPVVSAAVSLEEVSKAYGTAGRALHALDRVSLRIERGQFVCVVGASGCGKSTMLNLIAGLDSPTSGTVTRDGGDAAMLFQDAALFPWLTAAANVELALRFAAASSGPSRSSRVERRQRALELLAMVGLEGFADKRPHELSGGMRQRVALARALAQGRQLLLMDEPFGALDAITRDLLHDELESIWRAAGLTVVFVTHDVTEAARLADRVVLLSSRPGRVLEVFPVELERPRPLGRPEVAELSRVITDRLRKEVRRHGSNQR